MPNVLLISFYYPPRPAIGSLRPKGLAKHLPEFGWNVIVLTTEFPGRQTAGRVIETEYRDVLQEIKAEMGFDRRVTLHQQLGLQLSSERKDALWHTRVLKFVKSWLAYPDAIRGWIPFANEAVIQKIRPEDVDVILTTSPPASCHLIGAHAKKVLRRPWIADFRDLWTQNVDHDHGLLQLRKVRLEKKTLSQADALITVSQPWAQRLRQRYRTTPIHAITNGFDPDEFSGPHPPLTKELSITYAGQLYGGKRDPTVLLEVLAELIREGRVADDIRIRFYGPFESWLPPLIDRLRLNGIVQLHGVVARDEVLQHEMESQLLLLLGWHIENESGQHTGKLFEYFGAARPILAIGGGPGVLTATLKETKTGVHALSKDELRLFLLESYAVFRAEGAIPYHCDAEAVNRYTQRAMAISFAEVLTAVHTAR